jgi:hypothetical protein
MSTMSDDMTEESTAALFGEFCLAGLWPGVGRALVEKLRAAGITRPADVTASRLELVEGIGPKRAAKLAASFGRAGPAYETAKLLIQCRVPVRYAGSAVALLGPSAARQLRDDPWKLLLLTQIRPDQADWFARKLLAGQADRQDPRRGRALVVHLLVKASRDGHTAVPSVAVIAALGTFGVDDPGRAVAAAIDDGAVLPFEAFGAGLEPGEAEGPREIGPGEIGPGEIGTAEIGTAEIGTAEIGTAEIGTAEIGTAEIGAAEIAAAEATAAAATAAADVGAAGAGGPGAGVSGAADGELGRGRGTLLALTQYAIAEESVAEGLQRLAATAEPVDGAPDGASDGASDGAPGEVSGHAGATRPGDAELDDRQRAAVQAVAEHGVSVLTGGPGTGKSRTVAAVVSLAAERGLRVALAAPTGRAAKRLEELAGAPATTLHRLLGAQGRGVPRSGAGDAPDGLFADGASAPPGGPGSGDFPGAASPGGPGGASEPGGGREGSWVFSRGEEWPLDADLVVVDESSMLDVELAAALIEACADGTRLLLVGDPAQLPSIGPGRVLADVIDSGAVPVTELTTLYRQRDGGTIAKLATAVRGGDLPSVDSPEREVVIVTARGSAEAAHRVVQLVTDSIPRALGIAAEDVQVVTPVHKGPAGTIELNKALKAKLNPGPGVHRGFDAGDRVVAIANHAEEGFANGEVGTVTGTESDGLTVSFSGLPVTVPFKLLGDLRHGWALTVHRAQGSEWPAVVAVFPAEASGMLSRPLIYTALTRAQQHLSVVHGAGPALARAVRTIGERPRETRLAALLSDG